MHEMHFVIPNGGTNFERVRETASSVSGSIFYGAVFEMGGWTVSWLRPTSHAGTKKYLTAELGMLV